jgi:hypothetical protein
VTIPPAVFNASNVVVFLAIVVGVIVHKKRIVHARIMTTCFVVDVLIVLVIELQRKAIEQAMGPTRPLMKFHIAVSVAALVLWVPQILTGRAILRGKPRLARHRIQAWTFLLCRSTNVVTAFLVSP